MVQFNFSERTIKAKVVYYGPAQSGKTTNLEQIHRLTDPESANRLISLNTAQDRTLFFDLLPFSLGSVSGYDFKIQLYTVPGQVQYNATRRVVLAGADAVVFVADSQRAMARENALAFENMKVNLLANRLVPEKVPLVLQYNKQDLPGLLGRDELDSNLNFWSRRSFPAVAARGQAVMETFVAVVQEMLVAIATKYNLKEKGLDPEAVPEIVAAAFERLVRKPKITPPLPVVRPAVPRGPALPAAAPALSAEAEVETLAPSRVVIAQPEGVEPAHAAAGIAGGSVSEELLHRAIRSNVDLAEVVAELSRDVALGLALIHREAETLAADSGEPARGRARTIAQEALRLYGVLRKAGPPTPVTTGQVVRPPSPAPVAPAFPATPRPGAGTRLQPAPAGAAVGGPSPVPHAPSVTPFPSPTRLPPAPPGPLPAAAPPRPPVAAFAPAAAAPTPAAPTLDGLLAELAGGLQSQLAARPVTLQSHVRRGTPLPRCSPAGMRRTLGGFVLGLLFVAEPASTIAVRADRKTVLLRGRDGHEEKRDFLMLAFAHSDGLGALGQQRVLNGSQPGPLGDGHKALRELGGFLRFAPLPGRMLETRLFLPL